MQLGRGFIFIDRIAGLDRGLQPVEETLHRDSVLKVGFLHSGHLHIVLYRLAKPHRRRSGDDVTRVKDAE